MSGRKTQLEEYREEFALLEVKVQEMKAELSLLGPNDTGPEYRRIKTDLFFCAERHTIVKKKIRYRVKVKKDNAKVYKTVGVEREAIIEGFRQEKVTFDTEIAERREELRLERAKTVTSKRMMSIAHLEEKLKVSTAKKRNTAWKIRYHKNKLKW